MHLLKKVRLFLLLAAIASLLLAAGTLLAPDRPAPSFAETKSDYRPSESWLLDRNGEVVAVKRVDDKTRRLDWVGLDEVSPAMQEWLLLSEDKRFYRHGGTDWLALASGGVSYLRHFIDGSRPRGASTLTMQLAGFLDPSLAPANSKRTLAQKWRQIVAARAIEKRWSKQQILETYLNLASFRGELNGIHAASFALFGVHPSALNRPQALLLAALLKGPTATPERAANRACALIRAAQQPGDTTCDELHALARLTLETGNRHIVQESIAPHLAQKLLLQPGVRLASTLDANLQRHAMRALHEHLMTLDERHVKDGSIVVIDNRSGDVLAYVGSSGELSDAPNVDGAAALRQAGSTLKPFLYGMALQGRQLTAASVLDDSPIQLNTPMGLYIPQNYDRDFKGAVSVRTALASSLNVPAVRALGLVGVDNFVRTLRTYGLDSLTGDGEHYGFSLALGGVDVRLVELTNAYRALANRGVWRPLRFTAAERGAKPRQLISPQAAFIVASILSDKTARAMTFGLENPLATRVWTAVKTGTSKDMRDNWCIGFSIHYTVGVWVGNFNGEPMHDVSGVSGAAPVWREMMDYLHAHDGSAPPTKPDGVTALQTRFTPAIESPRTEWFLAGTETAEIRLVAANDAGRLPQARILYPTGGTVIGMDPDIPSGHQRVQLSAKDAEQVKWLMDGNGIGEGADIGWTPTGGRHRLVLTDAEGKELDAVSFEVRGALP
ncbi:MAG: penicillin-binding protein 1C [Nitrosomonadales bacterium]|nr:penicillin-binding protein 1C [Nitrosomonadales bacterium]